MPQTLSTTVIDAQGLTKRFGNTAGVDGISFQVRQGEVFGYLGPNGAGKTTTIRLLLDLLRPTAGTVRIFDRPVSRASMEIRKHCGYLPGAFKPVETMTADRYLAFCAALRKISSPALQPDLLDRFQLSPKDLQKKVKHLSHGTRQKLGIIQAFFHRPELVILDEPTNGLDPLMQEIFYSLVKEAAAWGTAVFFSSHNLVEVEKVCDRVAIIKNGRIMACETLEKLKQKRFRRLELTLEKPMEALCLPNAREILSEGNRKVFLIHGEMAPILKAVADLPVADVVLPQPDLEEVFMAYYKKGENG